jgi:23S rRNA pseudouridine1911/1915/1917 synthase
MSRTLRFHVSPSDRGTRIDKFLLGKTSDLTRSRIQHLIRAGHVRIDEREVKPNSKVQPGDRIILTLPPPEPSEIRGEEIPLDIVYEDESLLVVNKPPGLVVHPAAGHRAGTLVNALIHHCGSLTQIGGVERPGIVHRLDKDTSGLMAVAKTDPAYQSLSSQIRNRTLVRKYLAVVRGHMKPKSGTIETEIGRHAKDRKRMSVRTRRGREAVTAYLVLEEFPGYSLVEATLGTGRTHQIRVQFTHIGHPVVGDPVYGRAKSPWIGRQALHAHSIQFAHPEDGRVMNFLAPLPKDMETLIEKLKEGRERSV